VLLATRHASPVLRTSARCLFRRHSCSLGLQGSSVSQWPSGACERTSTAQVSHLRHSRARRRTRERIHASRIGIFHVGLALSATGNPARFTTLARGRSST
jgi:hypothetical protein